MCGLLLLFLHVKELFFLQLLVGDELRDIVKGYLAKLDSEGPLSLPQFPLQAASGSPSDSQEDDMMWQKALRWCPRELLELVNSKACRGGYDSRLFTLRRVVLSGMEQQKDQTDIDRLS